jgi:Sap, sulfolipid-1-addressing protein
MQMPLLGAILGLALADSLNPASIAVAGYLRFARGRADVIAFAGAAYVTYLAVAFLLTDAVGPAARIALRDAPASTRSALQVGVGAVLITTGLRTWRHRGRRARPAASTNSAFALGVAATVMDLPTALPLVAASGLILAAHPGAFAQAGLLNAYVLVCAAPLLAIALIPERLRNRRSPIPFATRIGLTSSLPVLLAGLCIVLGAAAGGEGVLALA